MSKESAAAHIAKAWQSHREGRNGEAVSEFNRILKDAPDSVDAYYGLGLAQRSDGQNEAAVKSFQKALSLARESMGKFGVAEVEEQTQREDNLLRNAGQDARFAMLQRMLKQRLAELDAAPQE